MRPHSIHRFFFFTKDSDSVYFTVLLFVDSTNILYSFVLELEMHAIFSCIDKNNVRMIFVVLLNMSL